MDTVAALRLSCICKKLHNVHSGPQQRLHKTPFLLDRERDTDLLVDKRHAMMEAQNFWKKQSSMMEAEDQTQATTICQNSYGVATAYA